MSENVPPPPSSTRAEASGATSRSSATSARNESRFIGLCLCQEDCERSSSEQNEAEQRELKVALVEEVGRPPPGHDARRHRGDAEHGERGAERGDDDRAERAGGCRLGRAERRGL